MENIVQSVYNSLKTSTEQIGKTVVERDKLEEKVKSGRYSPQALKDEVYPTLDFLRAKVRDGKSEALAAARGLVKEYEAEVATMNDLNPEEITPDLQLLQSGIPLMPNDIQAMLKRNSGNRTMLQLILRFAEQNGIDTHGTYFIGGQQEAETAKNLYSMIDLYSKYLDQPDGVKMLNKFFKREGTT